MDTTIVGEIHIPLCSPPILWCYYLGGTFITVNPIFHSRTKYVEIDLHLILENVTNKQVVIRHISTSDQVIDALTKHYTY